MTREIYETRGVSTDKPDVKRAIENISKGLFPGAFCKALPDIFTNSQDHCTLLHADGAGTKCALAYLHYKRHLDPSVFEGIAQDSLVMNLDDLLCVGATGPFILSNIIGRNAKLIDGSVVEAIIHGYERFISRLAEHQIAIHSCGGETADVGDLVRTVSVDSVLATRMSRSEFIDCSRITDGQHIVGFASYGKANYESKYNSGIGTNGFTAARHELLCRRYRDEFPETFAPEIHQLVYSGKYDIDDPMPGEEMTIAEALLSPTRTYSPIIAAVLAKFRNRISAIFHNTGGGQTKCLRFGTNVRYVKDKLFDPPPIFDLLRKQGTLSLREMFKVFNMGHRLEIVCDPMCSNDIIKISTNYGVDARIIGRTEYCEGNPVLTIITPEETLEFRDDAS